MPGLGLPEQMKACLFDLDGVLTDTASVHAAAWQEAFDKLLEERDEEPFRQPEDYDDYVDGKPREDGVRDFLESRQIELPEGDPDDEAGTGSVHALATLKNELLLERIRRDGVEVYPGSRRYLTAAREAGLRCAVVSSSANTHEVLDVTGLAALVEKVVDGNTLHEDDLRGKPAPDSFLRGADELGVSAAESVVFEDALAGVEAGHAGEFGYVVGVNRLDEKHGRELREHGADVVVKDLGELL